MRIAALMFFVQTFPLVLFLTTILYGGFSTTVLKEELAKSGMYEKVISVAKAPPEEGEATDPVFAVISSHINAPYLQTKVEGVIDDTALWVTGKTQTPPTLSFKDIKQEIEAANPTLLADIQKMSQEMQAEAAANGEVSTTPSQPNELETFVKNDFSFPLQDSFAGIKQSYMVLTIAVPVVIISLLLSLVLLWIWNHTWPKRLRWFGITFILSAIFGYITILLNQRAADAALAFLTQQKEQILQMIYPILERIVMLFITQYASYQTIANYVFLSIGIVSLILSFVIKSPGVPVPAKQTKTVKKSR